MLKYLQQIDWGAISTSALVLIFVSWLLPLPPQAPPANNRMSVQHQGGYQHAAAVSKLGSWIDSNRDDIAAVSTFFIAAFTLTLFFATFSLRRSNEKTITEMARIAEEEFVASHPPHIRVKHVSLVSDIWHGEQIRVRTTVVNAGKTLALVEAASLITLVLPNDRELPNETEVLQQPQATFTPPFLMDSGITLVLPLQTDGRVLSEGDHAAIREGTKYLYVIGHIDYRDRAGRVKKTSYCRVLSLRPDANVNDRGRLRVHADSDYEYSD